MSRDKHAIHRVLIVGATGSGGSYLAEYLTEHQPQVELHGTTRWHATTSASNLEAISDRIRLHETDLCDFSSVLATLREARPDAIFHLAAHANVRAGFVTPLAVIQNNIMGTANLFEAVRALEIDPVIQLCSTSEVYGQVDPELVPIDEQCPLNPSSPYAVSKASQDHLGFAYFRSYGQKIVRTRMFAYLNPRRSDLFATSFARQVARIELGLQPDLRHGNLDSVRTLIDVRDAMESYWLALLHGKPGEVYNIGGVTSISVGEFLDLLKKKASKEIPCRLDESLLRPSDVTLQIPNTTKFQQLTGWSPRYEFEDSVEMLLDHCRRDVRREEKH